MAYFVNVYLVDRAFGGPEEGGWWYDTGDAKRSIPCYSRKRAEAVLKKVAIIVQNWNVLENRREPNSVLCDGWYRAWIEREPAKDFPEVRPHYE